MYPARKDFQNGVLVKLLDEKNNHQIRTFWTQEPKMFLDLYTFIEENNIDIDLDDDCNEKDPYNNMIGEIKDIIFSAGGKNTFNVIEVYLEVRDYR